MELERLPKSVLERAGEIVGLSGELLDPEIAALLALHESGKLPVPAPGLHHDILLGVCGECVLDGTNDPQRRRWSAHAGEAACEVMFEAGAPAYAAPGVIVQFIGGEIDPRIKGLVRLPPDALVVPAAVELRFDPARPIAGLNDIGLEGVLVGLDGTRSFLRRDGTRGFVSRARVQTDDGVVEVTLWDDAIRPLVGAPPGCRVRLSGLYTKEREGRVEVLTGREAVVEVVEEE